MNWEGGKMALKKTDSYFSQQTKIVEQQKQELAKIKDYYWQKAPLAANDMNAYYPFFKYLDYAFNKGEQARRGLGTLMALIPFFESSGGRTTKNIYGVLPGGESSGRNLNLPNLRNYIDYQLSPNVFGGGVGGKLNLLATKNPLTTPEVSSMYRSYGGGKYNPLLLKLYGQITGL